MTKNKKMVLISVLLIVLSAGSYVALSAKRTGPGKLEQVRPMVEDITLTLVTTGLVEPRNRLQVKPSIGGRIEEIPVREGERVKSGQVLARMSSTERAALIDAARLESDEVVRYWEEVYRKSPIISPIDGDVIARYVEPGQTVSASDTILVLSDRLVVKAQFDETDIGRVEIGQDAVIILDAYPDVRINGTVDHIAYEAEVINNVTIYNVDILIDEIPRIFRSGMSVTVELIEKARYQTVTIPSRALKREEGRTFVIVRNSSGRSSERDVRVGIDNDKRAEILSGVKPEDTVLMEEMPDLGRRRTTGTNPFLPSRRR